MTIWEALSAAENGVLSQVQHGKAAEINVNPSSEHGHVGDNSVFVLTNNVALFELLRSSNNLTYIFGDDDHATYADGGAQTIYDCGKGTTLQFSNETGSIRVYGFENDPTGTVVLTTPVSTASDGHGGTLLGNIDFIGDSRLSMAQVTIQNQ